MIQRLIQVQLILVFTFLTSLNAQANLKLPELVSNGMVLQRNEKISVWGWSETSEPIRITFRNSTYKTRANDAGKWALVLPEMNTGGPYTMRIETKEDTITIHDIMVGEVWVSSGQSNMELPVRRVRPLYKEEIAYAQNDSIRYFDVPDRYNFHKPQPDLPSGSWKKTTPENVLEFSAAAWFFARRIYKQYNIPVGIINASLGGSPAEAWISENTLKKKFPEHYETALKFRDSSVIKNIKEKDHTRRSSWYKKLNKKDSGYREQGKNWKAPGLNDEHWAEMKVPGYWSGKKLSGVHGSIWFRKEFNLPEGMADNPSKLLLGRVVDADSVFINGEFVGTTGYQYPPRRYDIPDNLLKAGQNTIVVRVINKRGKGGFIPDKPYKLIAGNQSISLKGTWKYKTGAKMPPLESQTFIRWKPMGLFNGMIAPLLNYSIRGVIWYQGESNTDQPKEYKRLFPELINDWRKQWEEGAFPFLYVQLANYKKPDKEPSASNWALLREAQLQTLSLPNTGMAVTIDIGEWNDIHPMNKKDVGKRLALNARKIAYGEDNLVHSGPLYQSMEKKGNKIVLSFNHTGSGLVAKGDDALHHFAIAGPDKEFVWAKARIKGNNKVMVWSNKIENPVAVRYAWADNPRKANLYNKEGLPASPFRTNNW